MSNLVNLLVRTADDRPLMHKFYRQEEEAHGLLVTFPGKNYGVDGPMLYYPSELLMAAGWDTLAVSYGFQTGMQELSPEVMSALFEECWTVIKVALGQREYRHIDLIGKSIGAGAVAHLFQVYPQSANPYDSLGEAYILAGDTARAIEHYEKALVLDPELPSAKDALEKLKPVNKD